MAARKYEKKTAQEVQLTQKVIRRAEDLIRPREAGNLMRYLAKRPGVYDGI